MFLKYQGFLVLILFSIEVLATAELLWRLTGFLFFKRWLLRLSWILPLYLILAYRIYGTSRHSQTIRTFLDYQRFQLRTQVRDSEILAACYMPYLTATICILILAVHLRSRFDQWMRRRTWKPVVGFRGQSDLRKI